MTATSVLLCGLVSLQGLRCLLDIKEIIWDPRCVSINRIVLSTQRNGCLVYQCAFSLISRLRRWCYQLVVPDLSDLGGVVDRAVIAIWAAHNRKSRLCSLLQAGRVIRLYEVVAAVVVLGWSSLRDLRCCAASKSCRVIDWSSKCWLVMPMQVARLKSLLAFPSVTVLARLHGVISSCLTA